MQPSILFLLLGWLAVVNSFGLDLRFLNPLRSSDDNNEQHLSPPKPNMCNPTEPRTLIRSARKAQLLRSDFVPLPTLAPTNNPDRGSFVPLPTLAPTSTSTTTQVSRSLGNRQENPSNDCDPFPLGIGTRLSAQLLKVLTILG
ncbi:uncharacterized protein LOC110177340 isoform X2 [Drosophila serrata]|uniref:uncharacterized protein LOC110177340 isoform X2 n=1 Tax=Drosophila serrata TaxID=7274 RepID=UPI000A1D2FA5|nr:uncharacterized protein LOC110177340 isoform X2 [Drosophila serrata]